MLMLVVYFFAVVAAGIWVMTGGSAKLALGLAVAPAAVVVSVMRPAYLFAMCMLLGLWHRNLGGGFLAFTPYKATLFLFLGTALFDLYRRGPTERPQYWYFIAIALLIPLVGISELRNLKTPSVGHLFRLISFVIVGLCARAIIRNARDMLDLSTGLSLAVLAIAFIVYRKVGWQAMEGAVTFRARILGGDPNAAGTAVLTWTLIGLPRVLDNKASAWRRVLALASLPAFVYVLFATASRGVTAAAFVGFAGFAMLVPRTWSGRLGMAAVGVVAVMTVAAVAPKGYVKRMASTVEVDENTGEALGVDDSGRADLAKASIKVIAQSPLIGRGASVTSLANARNRGAGTSTHSHLLRLAECFGIPALLVVLGLLARGAWALKNMYFNSIDDRDRLTAAALGAALTAAFISSLGLPSPFPRQVWMLLALILVLNDRRQKPSGSSAREQGPVAQRFTGVQPVVS